MFDDILSWQRSAIRMSSLMVESQSVVAMRVMGFGGIWSLPPSEGYRMVTEKSPAMLKSWWGMQQAISRGANPERVLAAWTGPLEREARSNRKRLARRGPKLTPGLEAE